MKCPRLHLIVLLIAAMFAAHPALAQTDTRTLGSFTYDGSGNVTSMGPDSDGLMNEYEYDSAGRLIHFVRRNASTGATVLTESYDYDAYGNQTWQTTNSVVTSLSADAGTNRLTGATYDQAGNMTQYGGESYTFDPVGTMTTKSGSWGTATYIYTADDERIAIAGPDGTWRYTARDLDGKVLREWSAGTWNGSWTWVEDYVYRDGQLAAAARPASQGGTRHFHLDHLGSPRLISSDSKSIYAQHAYYPFGREISSPTQELSLGYDTPEPMKYTGHERDFAGSYSGPVLDYMHARYYNPWTARFLSPDPVPGLSRIPQSWNRYAYARNNPAKFIDPTGRYVTTCVTGDLQCQLDAAYFEGARQQAMEGDAAAQAQAAAYGEPGFANGVTVSFSGALAGTAAQVTSFMVGENDGSMRRQSDVVFGQGLGSVDAFDLMASIAHEGQHILAADAFAASFTRNAGWYGLSLNLQSYRNENLAYHLTHELYSAAGRTFNAAGCAGCTLGAGVTAADVQLHIDCLLANPPYGVTPERQGSRLDPTWSDDPGPKP